MLKFADIEPVVTLAREASKIIMTHYNAVDEISITTKPDNSPVTKADIASHELICSKLAEVDLPQLGKLPIISEEDKEMPAPFPKSYWCVDPLDGTKEFIHKTGEFSINIAIIHHGEPIVGIIFVPTTNTAYVGIKELGAKSFSNRGVRDIATSKFTPPMRIVLSRRHDVEKFASKFNARENISVTRRGSAIKFVDIALGNADLMVRAKGSSEWDNAAGIAIVTAAGGQVLSLPGFQPLSFGQNDSPKQSALYAVGDPNFNWKILLGGF